MYISACEPKWLRRKLNLTQVKKKEGVHESVVVFNSIIHNRYTEK